MKVPLYFTVILLCSLLSCSMYKNALPEGNNKMKSFSNKDWHDTLVASIDEMKACIKTKVNFEEVANRYRSINSNSSEEMQYNIIDSKKEFEKMSYIPIESYVITSSQLSTWDTSTPVESLFALERNRSETYLVLDKYLVYNATFIKKQNSWAIEGMGALLKNNADTLYRLLFDKHKYFSVASIKYPSGERRSFYVYENQGKLQYISFGGKSVDFVSTLREYKTIINQPQ